MDLPDSHWAASIGGATWLSSTAQVDNYSPWAFQLGLVASVEAQKRLSGGLFAGVSLRYQYTNWRRAQNGYGGTESPHSHTPQALAMVSYLFHSEGAEHGPRFAMGPYVNYEITDSVKNNIPSDRARFGGFILDAGWYSYSTDLGVFGGGSVQVVYDNFGFHNDDHWVGVIGMLGFSFGRWIRGL
jgi:hypothetical protein